MLFHEREFKAHLDKALKAALTEYQAEEVKRAENAREATKKARGHNTIGEWDEQYELNIRHTNRWGFHNVQIEVRGSTRQYRIQEFSKGLWRMWIDLSDDESVIVSEPETDMNSLIQRACIMSLGHAYFEPELWEKPKPAKVKAATKRRG